MVLKKVRKEIPKGHSKNIDEEEMFDFIQDRAFRLWDQADRPQGKDWEFWFMAERDIRNRLKKIGKL